METEEAMRVICVDWGTSNLRLYLVHRPGGRVLADHNCARGILDTFRAWQKAGGEREAFYLAALREELHALEYRAGIRLQGLPLILSGMASSSVGIRELPYGDLPQPLAACRLPCRRMEPTPGFPHSVLLVSGVRKTDDVMRGEEVQALGLPAVLPAWGGSGTLVLPGTHSKHLLLNRGTLVDFRTFMTGELFRLLSRQSILAQSIHSSGEAKAPLDRRAFEEGLQAGREGPLSQVLFRVRARNVLGALDATSGAAYLSGILIGHELSQLDWKASTPIFVAADTPLLVPYRQAISAFGGLPRTRFLSPTESRRLLVEGQLSLL